LLIVNCLSFTLPTVAAGFGMAVLGLAATTVVYGVVVIGLAAVTIISAVQARQS
jgi:hypothetical protein